MVWALQIKSLNLIRVKSQIRELGIVLLGAQFMDISSKIAMMNSTTRTLRMILEEIGVNHQRMLTKNKSWSIMSPSLSRILIL
jgi:hypothetical protein